MIDNVEKTFDEKMNECSEIVFEYLGLPGAVTFYKKYLL